MSENNTSLQIEDDAYKRYLIKKNIEILKNKTGFHTALISYFIPPTRKLFDAIGYLKNEISESSNIKSKGNRKNVLDSINILIGRLKTYKEVPPKGLIMYAGQIPVNNAPGTERSELYVIEPPEPVQTFKYYCASGFLLEPLYEMVRDKGTFGIINIENKEASIGWVRGSHMQVERTMTSGIHSKHDAGGQSQRRFERLIEEGAQQFYLRVGDAANEIFLPMEEDIKGIFISGAGMAKEKFREKGVLDYRLDKKVSDLVDVAYSGEAGIRETIMKVQDKIASLRYVQEKKIYARYMNEIVKDTGKATYGEKEIRKALHAGAVEILLLSEKLDKRRVFVECAACQYKEEKTIKPEELSSFTEQIRTTQCPQCASLQYLVKEDIDLVENLGSIAELQGTKVEMLSKETEEGESLFSTFGGIAALLRFQI